MECQESKFSPVGVCEFIIYYKKTSVLIPMATLIGTITEQFDGMADRVCKDDAGTIRTVLISSSDRVLNKQANDVRHSPDLTVIWTESDSAVIDVIGECGHGFRFGKRSLLKVRGKLFAYENGANDKEMSGVNRFHLKKGRIVVTISRHCATLDAISATVTVDKGSTTAGDSKTGPMFRKSIDWNDSGVASPSNDSKRTSDESGQPVPERLLQSQTPHKM